MTETQKKAFESANYLISTYRGISPKHADASLVTIAGDMIADIQFAMSHVWEYPAGDVESVRIAALTSLKHN